MFFYLPFVSLFYLCNFAFLIDYRQRLKINNTAPANECVPYLLSALYYPQYRPDETVLSSTTCFYFRPISTLDDIDLFLHTQKKVSNFPYFPSRDCYESQEAGTISTVNVI
jgi:hypothetical protein